MSSEKTFVIADPDLDLFGSLSFAYYELLCRDPDPTWRNQTDALYIVLL
jgi:hypothetical protein